RRVGPLRLAAGLEGDDAGDGPAAVGHPDKVALGGLRPAKVVPVAKTGELPVHGFPHLGRLAPVDEAAPAEARVSRDGVSCFLRGSALEDRGARTAVEQP